MMNQPKQTVSLTSKLNRPYYPTGGTEKGYLLLEIRGSGPKRSSRAPINLSLVLDRSGSMEGDPLDYSKKACQFVADQMNVTDRLSLVTFEDQVQTVVAPALVTDKNEILRRIEAIQTGGCTNLSGGLIEGGQHVREHKQVGAVNRVILLSDGHANRGITAKSKLAAIARECRSAGVGITAMGVGDGFDEELMEALAEHGGGNFYYIDTPESIPTIFQQELQGLLSVVAQNMKLKLQSTEFVRVTGVYGYQTEELDDGLKLNAGDLYQDEVKMILVELAIKPHVSGHHPLLHVQIDYTDVTEGAAACIYTCEVQAEFTDDIRLLRLPDNREVQRQVEISESANVIEAAMEALDRGDLAAGKQMLQEQADHMLRMSDILAAPLLASESEKLFSQLNNFEYSRKTRKELHEQKYKQRKGKSE